jgi:proteasome beta subunit
VWIRGVLYYQNRWGDKQLANMDMQEATITMLRLLDAASEYDAATSGYNPKSNIFPTVKTITKDGIQDLSDERLSKTYTQSVETIHAR